MSVWRKYIVIITLSLAVALFFASCNNSKASQCRRLITAVNHGSSLLEANKTTQVTTSLKLADDLKSVTNQIRRQNLKDPKLKEYQIRFVNIFAIFSQNINKAAKALGSAKIAEASPSGRKKMQKARDEIDTALQATETAAKQSDVLAVQVNIYCSQLD